MPVVDLRQWRVHISGREGTPWEGGVYSMDVIFWPGSLERIPRFRFVPPLFHPNVFPSGTWGYFFLPDVVTVVDRFEARWTKTPAEDPYQFAKLLSSIENVLHEPVISNPSQSDAYSVAKNDPEEYEKRVRAQAVLWKPHP
ncbi:ubiquitin-conjugating enzyme/RWD-like protein [Mycena sanguinolenta]|nr:ubiquitin-conjugating enzyme/RWD-like protein [Mycena sanguinolenta]